MGAGAMTICHSKTAVQVKEDMKKMVQIPILKPRPMAAKQVKLFGVPLLVLKEKGLVEDGVPLVVRKMVEHLRSHALYQEGLFRVNGNVRAVETLKQRLEGGEDVDLLSECDTCTVSSLLKQYLRDLPEGLVDSRVQKALIQHHQGCGDDGSWADFRDLLQGLPDVHLSLLRYLCHFLTLVESHHKDNRMTALNLATVFGPTVFHVTPSFEAMKDQSICNKIMVKLILNYSHVFETREGSTEELLSKTTVKTQVTDVDTETSLTHLPAVSPTPAPRTKVGQKGAEYAGPRPTTSDKPSHDRPRKRKVRKAKSDDTPEALPQPTCSAHLSHVRPHSVTLLLPLTSELRSPSPEAMETTPRSEASSESTDTTLLPGHLDVSPSGSGETLLRCKVEKEEAEDGGRPTSPFYMSFLDRTIRSAVEQHLFNVSPSQDQSLRECEPCLTSPKGRPTARQRRRHKRQQQQEQQREGQEEQEEQQEEQQEQQGPRECERDWAAHITADINKENIPSSGRRTSGDVGENTSSSGASGSSGGSGSEGAESQRSHAGQRHKHRKSKVCPSAVQPSNQQDAHRVNPGVADQLGGKHMELFHKRNNVLKKDDRRSSSQTLGMKIQESPVPCDTGRVSGGGGGGGEVRDPDCEKTSCEDVPRLDLTALTEEEEDNWGDSAFSNSPSLDFKCIFNPSHSEEPVPAYSLMQRESMDREEARLSPHVGGRLISQLLEEDSDPMVSPRFYAYGQSQQYLDDTEVPPSPPNAHSFISRRRSSSLGSYDDEKEEKELTSPQLTKRIHVLKKKIHRFEERFEEERKYRPSHSDKAANPEVLRWVNELARLRKELKEHKLMKSEEDLPPLTRQRSNTLPKSFGSQLDKKPQQEKVPKPSVEATLESILKKLQEKREEVNRPEDIKDMTREQIGAEKVALQKGLLYYESIHGRPVTKNERQIMKPLYDRYRLVKQILCRASTIPVIEEEDGSEDDADSKTQFTVTVRPDLSMLGFLDHLDEDGFISPVDELSPSKHTTDMRLSNLHSAPMQELLIQLQEAREEKKRIRKNLKEFEDQFFRQNGRNVQKEDRSPLAAEYNEYKHIKAKLRLLEVLISKRDSTKFI